MPKPPDSREEEVVEPCVICHHLGFLVGEEHERILCLEEILISLKIFLVVETLGGIDDTFEVLCVQIGNFDCQPLGLRPISAREVVCGCILEPEAQISLAMNAVLREFKRIIGLSKTEGEDTGSSATTCSIQLLLASSQAINLIGKQGSQIKAIQETSGASVRVLSGGTLHSDVYAVFYKHSHT
ncbi:hypothetical protein IFM89_039093 [Coptis chinensis]|uniref:K Homology domain-containing protein n=1 Tax=Coptis chinensis TaxID=261450 RepID=A0A835M8P4_9MAGN|nr:hypothetical protein IFM89_039093 [Coptis chinensis]